MKIYRHNANKPKFTSVDNSYETAKATLEKLEKEWDSMMGDFKSMGTKPKGYDELQRKLRAAQIAAREAYSKENAIADSDKAKLKQLKAQLEKAADGTDEEFKKAQKAYDDFMDTVKTNGKENASSQLAPLWKAVKSAQEAHQKEVQKGSSGSKSELARLWKAVKAAEDAYHDEVEKESKAKLGKSNSLRIFRK